MTALGVALLLGVLAFALVLAATDPPGPGLDPDAMSYLGAAESLAAHGGYRVPTALWWSPDSTMALAHFPPGYSTALALPMRLGLPPLDAARLVQALAAAATITLLVLLVAESVSLAAGVLLAFALCAMTAMHEVHVSVLSEPLFLACVALTLWTMARGARPLVTGLPAAAGVLVRYAGLSLVGGVALWAFAARAPFRVRVRRALLAALPGVLAQAVWVLRTKLTGGPAEIRRFALYGDVGPTLRAAAATLRLWLVPVPNTADDPLPRHGLITFAVALVLAALLALGVRRARALPQRGAAARRVVAACGLLIACYIAMLVVSRLVADPGIPFDERLMAPAFLLAATALATAIAAWWPRPVNSSRASRGAGALARVAVAVLLGAWGVASAGATLAEARWVLRYGSDFGRDEWRRSPLLEWARTEGAAYPLYSNWPSAVWFHLHRPAHGLPRLRDGARALSPFPHTLRARGGRVVEFFVNDASTYWPLDSLRPRLRVVARFPDGVVLAAPPARR